MSSHDVLCQTGKKRLINDRIILIAGIGLIGIAIPLIINLVEGTEGKYLVFDVTVSFIATLSLWLGCREILSYMWDKIPWAKYPLKHLIFEILILIVYSLLIVCILFLITYLFFSDEYLNRYQFSTVFYQTASISIFISFIHEGIVFFILWKESLIRVERLEKDSLISQYETLKSQVNPHFLFNSFNTLIALIEENQEHAVQYVQKLSDFYRSILRIKDNSVILVSEEINLIMDYYYIQKQRFENNLILEIDLPEKVLQHETIPLSLQMLVENAIKHNVISSAQPLRIRVFCNDENYILIQNNLQRLINPSSSGGIGLENIRNRYKFLTDKPVNISVSNLYFTVALPLLKK